MLRQFTPLACNCATVNTRLLHQEKLQSMPWTNVHVHPVEHACLSAKNTEYNLPLATCVQHAHK